MMQATLYDFKPKRARAVHEIEYLISEYIKAYGTDKYDKYDLYDFTWKCPGRLRIKALPRNGFFSAYRIYLKSRERRN